jgi:MYND finger
MFTMTLMELCLLQRNALDSESKAITTKLVPIEEIVQAQKQSTPTDFNAPSCNSKGTKWCSQCHAVKYCSRRCQVLDWKVTFLIVLFIFTCSVQCAFECICRGATVLIVLGPHPMGTRLVTRLWLCVLSSVSSESTLSTTSSTERSQSR